MGARIAYYSRPGAVWEIDPHDGTDGTPYQVEVCDWVRSLGIVPERLAPSAAIFFIDGQYELHVSVVLRNGRGGDLVDQVRGEVVSVPVVVPLGLERCWPEREKVTA